MYLKQLYVENNGPLRNVRLELPFTSAGIPKPVVLVGGNGSGKTNLMSIIADALISAAASHYTDVLAGMSQFHKPFFRLVGSRTMTVGASGSFTVMRFEHVGTTYFFKEKAGTVPMAEAADRLPESLRHAASWGDDHVKEFAIADEAAGKIFNEGVYVYFPSSRSETPHWLNLETIPTPEFSIEPRFVKRMRKPIYVEKGLQGFQQWLLSALVDSRCDYELILQAMLGKRDLNRLISIIQRGGAYNFANQILRLILCDDTAFFGWLGRQNPDKICIAAQGRAIVPTLGGLSAGQSTVLGIFGTILYYGDFGQSGPAIGPNEVPGMCLIDEIDAHMHVDLQHRVLPALIKLFPQIQFIVSSHSPLFALGMEKTFGADGLVIIDLPSGTPIRSEAYAEFGRALEVLQDTKAFAAAIETAAAAPGKALILLEGETDPLYLQAAADLLGRRALLEKADFEWIGAKDLKSGQAFHTGKDALNQTLSFLRAKPDFVKRPMILLYDHDTNKQVLNDGQIYVRKMPANPANTKVLDGIENLLPENVITEQMFVERRSEKRRGGYTIDRSLDKMKLCNHICNERQNPADFAEFAAVLDMIERLVEPPAEEQPAPED